MLIKTMSSGGVTMLHDRGRAAQPLSCCYPSLISQLHHHDATTAKLTTAAVVGRARYELLSLKHCAYDRIYDDSD